MGIWWVVSHAIRPAHSPLRAASLPVIPPSNPLLTLLNCILSFFILLKLFIAWQCSLVVRWCTLCMGMPKFSRGVMVY
jgi:hypothetical protein